MNGGWCADLVKKKVLCSLLSPGRCWLWTHSLTHVFNYFICFISFWKLFIYLFVCFPWKKKDIYIYKMKDMTATIGNERRDSLKIHVSQLYILLHLPPLHKYFLSILSPYQYIITLFWLISLFLFLKQKSTNNPTFIYKHTPPPSNPSQLISHDKLEIKKKKSSILVI